MVDRKKYPCEEVCPDDFLTNDEVGNIINNLNEHKFQQEDAKKLLNCVHCNECKTSEERIKINQKFLEYGGKIKDLDEMLINFKNFHTPYPTDKMRIRVPENLPTKSKTLFFMGCLSTIRIPRFTEHALQYLLNQKIDFTILSKEMCCGYPLLVSGETEEWSNLIKLNTKLFKENKYERIICLCPACYYIFNKHYPDLDIPVDYISDYLVPSSERKTGEVSIQHLCQLKNRDRPEVAAKVEDSLIKSGYKIASVPMWCCGGGIGYMHRTDVIDKIAEKRMQDFKGDFYTTYCPSCYWILKSYKKKLKNKTKLKDIFQLLL